MRARPAFAAPQPVAAAVLLLAWAAASPRVCLSQTIAALDAGASYVKYDGFLGAGAASLSGMVSWRGAASTLGVRGTLLGFETGHTSLQAAIAGSVLSPRLAGGARLEGGADASASSYEAIAHFGHVGGSGRVHWSDAGSDLWIGPSLGMVASDQGAALSLEAAAGAAMRAGAGTLGVSLTASSVGDTSWGDAGASWRWSAQALELSATAGLRFASTGAGDGLWGDASATWRLSETLALVLAGGRYPSDPSRGTIAGSYLTFGLRLSHRPPAPALRIAAAAMAPAAASPGDAAPARVSVTAQGTDYTLAITAVARRVELMGDFTSWQPVSCDRQAEGQFACRLRLISGLYRYNVRLDGGAWITPAGADSSADEFGSSTAILVVP